MKRTQILSLTALCLGLVGSVSAVTVVGPFVGSQSENFESVPLVFHVASTTVMGGELTISSPSNEVGIYQNGWGLGDKGGLNNGVGSPGTELEFAL